MTDIIRPNGLNRSLWKRAIIVGYRVLFFLTFANTLFAFGYFTYLRKQAHPMPFGDFTAPLIDHSLLGYVTPDQISLYRCLMTAMFVSVPVVAILGIILQVVIKIPVLDGER